MKKTIVIIFPDEWLSHSPTILNLIRSFPEDCAVKVISVDDGTFGNEFLKGASFSFIKINPFLARIFLRRARFIYGFLKSMLLLGATQEYKRSHVVAHVIAVDSIGLWVAQRVFKRAHFLSLEVKHDFFFRRCNKSDILSLVIQNEERARFLFGNTPPRTFFIQNSPICPSSNSPPMAKKCFDGRLVFLGNIVPEHGIFMCLDTIEKMADDGVTLTIKGVLYRNHVRNRIFRRYGDLIKRGTVILDQDYVPQDKIISFLSQFSIGFCLYDFGLISRKDFNYLSSPSGKVFNYYAAGIPVIGTDVLGLRSVRDFGAGVLLPEPSITEITQAVRKISKNFVFYHLNCLNAAKHFDFASAVQDYRDFLFRE